MKVSKFAVFLCTIVFTFGFLFINNAQATTIAYDDLGDWQDAVGGPVSVEDFESFVSLTNNTPIANYTDGAATDVNGSFSMQEMGTEVPIGTDPYESNFIDMLPTVFSVDGSNTNFRGTVQDQGGSTAARTRIRLIFPTEIYAFGADFASIDGNGIEFAIGSSDPADVSDIPLWPGEFTVISLLSNGDGFQGFTSDVAFNNVYLQIAGYDGPEAGDLNGEGFGMDNVRWSTTAPVPEPATMLLLGTGLVGLAAFGRKKFFKKK